MGLFNRKTEVREEIIDENHVSDVLLRALLDNQTITREMALTLPSVSGAVDFISNTVASMPVKLYKYKQGRVEEIDNDPRTVLLNGDTGDTLDAFQMKKAMVEDYLLGKGGYAYIRKDRNDVTGLFYVEEKYITIFKTYEPIYKKYQIMVEGKNYMPWDFIKLLRNTKDGASGVGLTVEVSKALETAYHSMLYQLGLVKSGGSKKGFLKSQRKLGQDEIDTLKSAWKRLYESNSENVVVLNNGLEFQEASSSSLEMQMNESKRTFADEINDLFHISNDFDLTFKLAIYPVIKAFETAMNRDLLLEKEKKNHFFEFDIKEIIKANLSTRYNAYKTAKETGFLTINEIRRMENLNYIDGMDVVNVGLGAVLFDTNTHKYYTPNTNTVGDPENAQETPVNSETGQEENKEMDQVIEDKEIDTAFEESGNSAERSVRFNENHDAKTGRFAPKGGSGWSAGIKSDFDQMENNEKALYLWEEGFLSQDDALKHMKAGDIGEVGKEYFQILEENGDYNPTKPTRDNKDLSEQLVNSGKGWSEARKQVIKDETGFSDEEAEKTHQELETWFGGSWDQADTKTIDKYVDSAKQVYGGEIYRGLHFDTPEEADAFLNQAEVGARIKSNGKNSSWSSSEETARLYSHNVDDNVNSVTITCLKNKTSVPVASHSTHGSENEVLASSKAEWTVLRKEVYTRPNGNRKALIYVVEADRS